MTEEANIVKQIYIKQQEPLRYYGDGKPTVRDMIEQLNNPFLNYIASDRDTFLHYGQRYAELDTNDIFNTKDTGLPTYNDMLKDPDYFEDKKNTVFKIIDIRPKDYKTYVDNGFRSTAPTIEEDLVLEYAKQVLDGSRMPMGFLRYDLEAHEYRGDYVSFTQEGMHRYKVAELLGAKKTPVMVVAYVDNKAGGTLQAHAEATFTLFN